MRSQSRRTTFFIGKSHINKTQTNVRRIVHPLTKKYQFAESNCVATNTIFIFHSSLLTMNGPARIFSAASVAGGKGGARLGRTCFPRKQFSTRTLSTIRTISACDLHHRTTQMIPSSSRRSFASESRPRNECRKRI